MNNFEKIKNMTLDELAEFLTLLQCRECQYESDYKNCLNKACWCHPQNGFESYKQLLIDDEEIV